jgi:uncharacterized protein (DUF433 family)
MIPTPAVIDVPLSTDKDGIIRIGSTRITLQTIIAAYQRGDKPEEIVEGFSSLTLALVHALISYYLSHQEEVDEYIHNEDAKAEAIRREIAEKHPEMLQGQAKFRAVLEENARKQK